MVACADAVLAESPLVERVVRARSSNSPRARWLTLRNPPSPRSTALGFGIEPSSGTPRQIIIRYPWPAPWRGQSGLQLPDSSVANVQGGMLADISTRLLDEVRVHCAPTAPGAPACSRVELGRAGRCDLGV